MQEQRDPPWLMACDANMCPEEPEPMVPKGADACGGSERSFHVQVEWPERVSGSKEPTITSFRVAVSKGKITQMEVLEDF